MTALQIRDVDASDPVTFAPFYEVYAAAQQHGPQGEFNIPWQAGEVRAAMAAPDDRTFRIGWSGSVSDRVVATGWMSGSTVDNTDLASVLVSCAPAEQGHGYATEMLAHVEQEARVRGRSRLVSEVAWPYGLGATGDGSAELAWARRQGFELALVDVQRRLSLPMPDARLAGLAAEAAPYHQGYELRSFAGRVPDELVEGWAELSASIETEAPTGDIEREATTADVEAVRAEETLLVEQGRIRIGTVAQAGDGSVVAYTDFVLPEHQGERAFQWGTLVRADHRGHQLGLAVKIANLRLLQETQPQITMVVTWNADVNAPMVAVNDRLGFRPVQWMGELQKKL